MAKPVPAGSILEQFEYLGVRSGERRWRSRDRERIYTWDAFHGEIEVFNKRGYHLGALDPATGALIKNAVKGRRIDV